ncbi:unnamed protein product [Gordionus sp. m RMFG-2023]|uniref:baculoviral IAP repeat-containing protein 7-like n=1 Tax=Gordionus sp. m RMFG-2023 TaxID=3053472 RepID=UPI0030DEF053
MEDLPLNCAESILGRMRNESDRMLSFQKCTNIYIKADLMAKAGFFYNGQDTVQCPFCKGVLGRWEPGDVPLEEHRRHFPHCPFILDLEDEPNPMYNCNAFLNPDDGHNFINESITNNINCTIQPIKDQSEILKLSQVKNLFFTSYDSRFETFACWPLSSSLEPSKMADAGFYYLGYQDYVKCFYCDGGLRNWKIDHDPWIEHAKWFSKCPFIEIVKGEKFVQDVNINYINKAENTKEHNIVEEDEKTAANKQASNAVPNTNLQSNIDNEMNKPMVKSILAIGVPKDTIFNAIYSYYKNGITFESSEALLKAISKKNSSAFDTNPSSQNSTITLTPTQTPDSLNFASDAQIILDNTPKSNKLQRLESENKLLKEQRFCKICLENEVEVVFINCGHFASCSRCALMLNTCPICREDIRGTVRTYLS